MLLLLLRPPYYHYYYHYDYHDYSPTPSPHLHPRYHPSLDAHQAVLKDAVSIEVRRAALVAEQQAGVAPMSAETLALLDGASSGDDDSDDGGASGDSDAMSDGDGDDWASRVKRQPRKRTKAERNKRKRHKQRVAAELQAKHEKALLASIHTGKGGAFAKVVMPKGPATAKAKAAKPTGPRRLTAAQRQHADLHARTLPVALTADLAGNAVGLRVEGSAAMETARALNDAHTAKRGQGGRSTRAATAHKRSSKVKVMPRYHPKDDTPW